jgi:hypothetical protein
MLSRGLRKDAKQSRKSIRAEAKELMKENSVARKSREAVEAVAGPTTTLAALAKGASTARTAARRTEEVLELFYAEVEMNARLALGRAEVSSKDLTERERLLGRFKRIASDAPKTVRAVLSFGLEERQVRTLDHLLGKLFGQSVERSAIRETRDAQDAARDLIAKMKGHWDSALPDAQTRAATLQAVFDELQAELKRNPNVNPSRFVRKKLFDPWRQRFMKRLGRDAALRAELRGATGIELLMDSDVPKFSLKIKVGGKEINFGFDVDHAETRLSDAVRNAKRPEDLLSVIESDGMQLLTPRENRIQIESLRRATREYQAKADEEAVAYFRRKGTSKAELESDIDRLIDVLNRGGDYL